MGDCVLCIFQPLRLATALSAWIRYVYRNELVRLFGDELVCRTSLCDRQNPHSGALSGTVYIADVIPQRLLQYTICVRSFRR